MIYLAVSVVVLPDLRHVGRAVRLQLGHQDADDVQEEDQVHLDTGCSRACNEGYLKVRKYFSITEKVPSREGSCERFHT